MSSSSISQTKLTADVDLYAALSVAEDALTQAGLHAAPSVVKVAAVAVLTKWAASGAVEEGLLHCVVSAAYDFEADETTRVANDNVKTTGTMTVQRGSP